MKKFTFLGVSLLFVFIISFSLFSCKSDTSNPVTSGASYDANTINGTITFLDTLFISDTTVGNYYISVFGNWPGNPTRSARIYPVKANNKYTANYKISVPNDGVWTVALAWVILPPNYKAWFLGVYDTPGNDTSKALIFGPHPKATITNGVGVGNINFNALIDTAKKLTVYPPLIK